MAKDESGLSILNANLVGATDPQMQSILDAQQAGLQALEQRYANPNWFNVAAGFFKPQLGGFAASLGSASQALGENVEKQRENMLPIAKMRSDIALTQLAMGQKKTVADMMANRKPGEPLTPEFVADVTARAPGSSVALALKDQLATQQAQRGLASSEQGNAMQRVQLARGMGQEPNPADLALIASGSPTLKSSAAAPAPALSGGAPAAASSAEAPSAMPEAPMPYTGTTLPADTLANLKNKAAMGDAQAQDALRAYDASPASKKPAVGEGLLPRTVQVPSIKDMPDPERQKAVAASTIAHAGDLEKVSNERYTNLTSFTAPENLPSIQSATKTALTLMDEDPQRAARVLNLVRKAGPVAAAFNAGVSAQLSSNLGSVGGSMSFPVEAWLKAGLTPDEQAYADKLTNALMTLKAAGVKMSSVSPTALVNHPSAMGSVQSMNFDMGQTPASLYNSVKHFQINQDFLKNYTDVLNSELKRVDPSSLAKFTDAFHSPKLKDLSDSYEKVHSALDKSYAGGLAKRKP